MSTPHFFEDFEIGTFQEYGNYLVTEEEIIAFASKFDPQPFHLSHEACCVPKGGVLLMHPLLLHSSSRLLSGTRKVLHFVYGPAELPTPMEWANSV